MTPERWAQLDALYAEATEADGPARAALLARLRESDPEMARELGSLLAAGGSAGDFLSTPAVDVRAMTSARSAQDALVGSSVGAYTIEERIGSGGMGVVYLARQQSPQRAVALKVVRPDSVTPAVLRRFEHEAEVLALLQHPGIAQIYESGRAQTPLGLRPYFAMELVKGLPLLSFAGQHELSTRARLELFTRVCDAVQYAHQRGVIHRDLKPGNILVTPEGQPKVLDFGVARLTGSDLRVTTVHTDIGQLLGTVPYMSPEQASGSAADLDVRSDVYALGVVLYELLAGKLPYDLRGKAVPEAVRVITEQDPTHLSNVSREFRGDVETIVAKALEKDKARRYQSAAELADDIRRYLADRAITARPASTIYQLRKFTRRNKVLVAGIASAFLLLCAGIVGTSIGMVRARDAEANAKLAADAAKAAEARAVDSSEQALRTNAYLRNTIGWFTPGKNKGPTVNLEDLLESVSKRISKELADQPAVAAVVHEAVCEGWSSLNKPDKMDVHAEKALECLARIGASDSADAGRCVLIQANAAALRGKFVEAEAFARRGVDLLTRNARPDHVDVIFARVTHGTMLRLLRKFDEALPILESAVADLRRTNVDGSKLVASLNELSVLYRSLGKQNESVAVMQEAIETGRNTPDVDDETMAVLVNNLGNRMKDAGNYAEAERLYRETLDIRTRTYGQEHSSVALAMNNLGMLYDIMDRDIEAIDWVGRAAEIRKRVLGEDHRMTISTLRNLAQMRSERGDTEAAIAGYRDVIARSERSIGPESLETGGALAALAGVLIDSGKLDEGEALVRRAIAVLEKSAPDAYELRLAQSKQAAILVARDQPELAEPIFRDIMKWLESNLKNRPREIAIMRLSLARCVRNAGRAAEALELAEKSVTELEGLVVQGSPLVDSARATRAGLLRQLGRSAEAEPELRSQFDAHVKSGRVAVRLGADCGIELALCLIDLARFEEAQTVLAQTAEAAPAVISESGALHGRHRDALKLLYEKWGKPELAEKVGR